MTQKTEAESVIMESLSHMSNNAYRDFLFTWQSLQSEDAYAVWGPRHTAKKALSGSAAFGILIGQSGSSGPISNEATFDNADEHLMFTGRTKGETRSLGKLSLIGVNSASNRSDRVIGRVEIINTQLPWEYKPGGFPQPQVSSDFFEVQDVDHKRTLEIESIRRIGAQGIIRYLNGTVDDGNPGLKQEAHAMRQSTIPDEQGRLKVFRALAETLKS